MSLRRAFPAMLALAGCGAAGLVEIPSVVSPAPAAPTAAPVATAVPAAPPDVVEDGTPLVDPGPELVAEGQSWLRDVRRWDGGLVALGAWHGEAPSFRLEPIALPERTRAVPLAIPGAERIVDLAMQGDTPIALVLTASGLGLASRGAAGWSIDPVPEPQRKPAELVLAARPDAVALLAPGSLHLLRGGAWTSLPLAPPPVHPLAGLGRASWHAVLQADRLLIGVHAGEWGGALLSLDLATGAWKRIPGPPHPVTDLRVDRAGRTWVSGGLAHQLSVHGSLGVLDASGWSTVTRVEGHRSIGCPRCPPPEDVVRLRFRWEHSFAHVEALALDDEGRLILGAPPLGLLRREGGGYVRLTPRWPRDLRLSGFAMQGSLAVIATPEGGVVLWDTRTGKAGRVDVPREPG
jgi:hypothetical protein